MRRKIYISLLLAFSLILFSQCEKNIGSTVGADFYNKAMGIIMPPITMGVMDTTYTASVPTGSSKYLYLGTYNKRKAVSFFRFTGLPDSVQIDSAIFTIRINRTYGELPADMLPDAYLLNYQFDENTFTWQDFRDLNPIAEKLDIQPYKTTCDSIISFLLPPAIVESWADTNKADLNYGFALTYDEPDTGFIFEIYSQNYISYDNLNPYLMLRAHIDDSSYTYTVTPFDVSVIEPDQDNSGYFTIGNGSGTRSLLFFSVDSIPEDATINTALLTIYADTTGSFPDNSESFLLRFYPVTDHNWPIPDVPYDTTRYSNPELPAHSDSLTINLTPFVQEWTSGKSENNGLIFMGASEGTDIMQRKFFDSSAAPEKRPSIKIFYTLPPKR